MLALILIYVCQDYLAALSPAKMLRLLAISFLVGVAVATISNIEIEPLILLAGAVGLLVALVGLWPRLMIRVGLIIMLGLVIGGWRWTEVNLVSAIDITAWHNQQVTWHGEVTTVDERIDQTKLTVSAQQIYLAGHLAPTAGQVLVSLPTTRQWQIGDRIEVACRLVEPESWAEFDYRRYLQRFGIATVCRNAQARIIGPADPSSLLHLVSRAKSYFAGQLDQVIGEPAGGIVQGMILGSAHRIDPAVYTLFVQLGLSHIIAISGSHITLIVALILATLIRLGFDRRQALLPLLVAIGLYVLLVGAPASALRAAVMGGVVLIGQQLGRSSSIINALLIAAALLVFFDPYALLFDIGFQLSFVAVIGLVYLAPFIDQHLAIFIKWRWIREIISLTLSAQILTLPLIIFYFTRFSIGGVIANIVIMPIIPLLMVASIIMILLAPLIPVVALVIGLVVSLLVDYWLVVAQWCADWFGASVTVPALGIGWMLLAYLILFGWLWRINRSWYNQIL